MRTILTTALCLLATASLHAQEERPLRTLLGNGRPLDHGGWGAATASYTRILDQDAMLVGARGAWMIDHRFSLGIAGHGLVIPVANAAYDAVLLAEGRTLSRGSTFVGGYGGLLLEPVIAYRSPVHITLPLIVGAGGVGYQRHTELPEDFDPFTYQEDVCAFFVVEPGVELEVNLIPLVRVGVGASYRYTSDITLPGTPKDVLHGLNAGLTIKVGSF